MRYCYHENAHAHCPDCVTDIDVSDLLKKLEDALMKIEIHENTINDLHLKIAFLES